MLRLTRFASLAILLSGVSGRPQEASSNTSSAAASPCCGVLSAALPGKVLYPLSDVYSSSTSSYWSLFESAIQPNCIVTPETTNDVSLAVKLIKTVNYASLCNFAIRGGGHTPWGGSANIDHGVTIDMRRMKSIWVNKDKTEAQVGAGAIWENVHRAMDGQGLSIIGGRASSVGVGGLTTGGGISYFSPRKGFACDNVVNYEVVLADGKIVNANAKTNSDLWLALKGGSNNFGIVTRFDLKAFEQGNFWGGTIIYGDDAAPGLLKAFADINRAQGYDEYASIIHSHSFVPGIGLVASANIAYTKAEAYPSTFKPYTDAQPQYTNSMRISNQTDFTVEFIDNQGNGRRQFYVTTTFKNDLALLQYAYNTLKTLSSDMPSTPRINLSLTLQPIPPAITSKSAPLGGNMLGLEDSKDALVLCLISASWDSSAQDQAITNVAKKLHDRIVAEAKRKGLWNRWIYLNYADKWQDPIGGYGATNKATLQRVSRKYDPEGAFQNLVPGGFKLFLSD